MGHGLASGHGALLVERGQGCAQHPLQNRGQQGPAAPRGARGACGAPRLAWSQWVTGPTGPGAYGPGLRDPQHGPLPDHLSPVRAGASQPQAGEASYGLGFCTPQSHQGSPFQPVHAGPEWPAPAPPPQASVDRSPKAMKPLTHLAASPGGSVSQAPKGRRPRFQSGLGETLASMPVSSLPAGWLPASPCPARPQRTGHRGRPQSLKLLRPGQLCFLPAGHRPCPLCPGDKPSSEHPHPARQAPALGDYV